MWLHATADGVGSARHLDRLRRDHDAYRWIDGDVPMNYHTLADLRTDRVELLDGLLTKSVATLPAEGLKAARERADRIKAALARLPELEARKTADEVGKARCATTDPDATVVKMADGGFRPAYNVQFATDVGGQAIVGAEVIASGGDAGRLVPMVGQVVERAGAVPSEVLVDGGYPQHDRIDAASGPGLGCTVDAPVPEPRGAGVDRHAP